MKEKKRRVAAQIVFLAYPCPRCGVQPGEPCLTEAGRRATDVHGARTQHGNRCPRCGIPFAANEEPGTLCARCLLVRALEIERVTQHRRRT